MEEKEEEDENLLFKSTSSMASITLGRLINSLLTARPRTLNDAVSRLSPDTRSTPSHGSLDESLWFLHKYVKDCAENKESLDDVLVPMLENSLRSKDVKNSHGGQSMVLLNWLFLDEFLFEAIAKNLAKIIATKDDRFTALGWCVLVRGLIECESGSGQYPMNGIRQRQTGLLIILSCCIPYLARIVCKGSTLQDGFELPSRLAVSAADCFLSITESLTKLSARPSNKQKSSDSSASSRRVSLLASGSDKKANPAKESSEVLNKEMEYLLWDHLEAIISLVEKLLAWSRKSRPLHLKGLEQILKWLKEIKGQYGHLQSGSIKTGAVLLISCWKHYSLLLRLEDRKGSHHYKELLEQYLSGLQFFADNHGREPSDNKESGVETIKFFLNCICLLLGRFDRKKFESIVADYGMRISHVILPQLHSVDEDVIQNVVCILKAFIFKPQSSSGSSHAYNGETDAMLPLLINLLDEKDATARAVIMLLAEYCLMSEERYCLQEVLKRLASEIIQQRKNAIAVISELIHISSDSTNALPQSSWQEIAEHLLQRLEDEETTLREQASNLLPMIDPSMVLPSLVHLVSSMNERVQSAAADALLRVLKYHSQNAEVICMLLDCLVNIDQTVNLQKGTGDVWEGNKSGTDQVLKLIPEWSRSVTNWDILIGPLVDKMFSHPANATIVRFFSQISRHLTEAADIVLNHILEHTKRQMDVDETRTFTSEDSGSAQKLLFEHLCPLLIIRMLPLSAFNRVSLSPMYGQLINQDNGDVKVFGHECIASLLFKRAFDKFEFEDVRKLAAELFGRIHPQVLIPILRSQLEQAASSRDLLKMKTCLFSLCTSLMVRGRDSLSHPAMLEIRKSLEKVLLWPSQNADEVSRAQHGCIDCLALMICADLQEPESSNESSRDTVLILGKRNDRNSVLNYVIDRLTSDKNEPLPLPFRLCMANVLISTCQKISDSGKKRYVKRALPRLIPLVEMTTESDMRAACIQVLFSAVYHLKSAVRPHACDLLNLALKALKKGSEKEKLAGAKLMASLMGSEDEIVESISGGLVEARSVLSGISSTDSSMEVREICSKLLACVTYP